MIGFPPTGVARPDPATRAQCPPEPLGHDDRAAAIQAINAARRRYPPAVANILVQEIEFYLVCGRLVDQISRVPRLIAELNDNL